MNAMKLVLPFGIERTAATAPLKKANSDVFSKRSCVLSAGTLSVLLALAGCGGGGGPAGVPSGAAFVYPSSLADAKSTDTVNGFLSPYALDATPQLVSVPQTIFATGATNGQLTITVSDIVLPSGPSPEPAFVVTFDPADSALISTLLANSPLGNSPVGGSCTDCLRTAPATTTGGSGGDVTFTYLDPAISPLNYSTLGMWSKLTTVSSPTWSEVGGPFSAGVLTRGIDLPVTGTASYDGYFIGRYATSVETTTAANITVPPGTYIVGANAHVEVVTFSGIGAVTFSTSNTHISQEMVGGGLATPILEQRLDFSTTTAMTISRPSTSNLFAGGPTTLTNDFNMAGEINGAFYGPPATTPPFAPPELGGSLAGGNATHSMVGSFGLKTP